MLDSVNSHRQCKIAESGFSQGVFMNVTPWQKWLFRTLACLVSTAMGVNTFAGDCGSGPTPYSANYAVTRGTDKDGSMHVVLERTGENTFIYRMDTRIKWGIFNALIEQRSVFNWRDGAVFPGSFQQKQKVSIYHRNETVEFDWDMMKATGTKKRVDFELELKAGMQDKLTIYLFLARAICEGQNPIEADVVSGPVLKPHSYHLQSIETLETSLGQLQVSHIRRGSTDDDKQTDLWLAREVRFLPVEMVYRDDDEVTRMRLIDISFDDQ